MSDEFVTQQNEDEVAVMYCTYHPDRETMLRCNRCEKPICTSCVNKTPTGYRCKDCIRGQQKVFDTAQPWDYIIAFFVAAIIAFLGSRAASFIGFFILIIAPIVGGLIAEAVRRAVKRRRSKLLTRISVIGAVVGCFPMLLSPIAQILFMLLSGSFSGATIFLLQLLWPGLYTFLVASTVYYRIGSIKLRR
ncbi:MAG: hypothetical protein JEZ06_08250 [Anaerolineaceae bacterium]|nr:hypothetical protein [Anaerolineaceae bacterium]